MQILAPLKNGTRKFILEQMINFRTLQKKRTVQISRDIPSEQRAQLKSMRELLGRAATHNNCELRFVSGKEGINMEVLNPRTALDFRSRPDTTIPGPFSNGFNDDAQIRAIPVCEIADIKPVDLSKPQKEFMENIKGIIKEVKNQHSDEWNKRVIIE